MGQGEYGQAVVAVEADEPRVSVVATVKDRGFVVEAVDSLAALGGILTVSDPAVIVVGDDLGRRPFRATRSRTDAPIVGLLGCSSKPDQSATDHVDNHVDLGERTPATNATRVADVVEEVVEADQSGADDQPFGHDLLDDEESPTDSGQAVTETSTASAPPADAGNERHSANAERQSISSAADDQQHHRVWTDIVGAEVDQVEDSPVPTADPVEEPSGSSATNAETEQTGPFVTSMTGALDSLTGTVIIGASAGGPGVLTSVLSALPVGAGLRVLVVQHLRDVVVKQFAARVDQATALSVSVASDERPVGRDEVVIARGNSHLAVEADLGDRLSVRCVDAPPQNDVKPAVDETMRTAASVVDEPLVGVTLTGIGVDGAAGLEAISEAGGYTIAQDEATSHIFGMPAAAIETGAVDEVLPGERITNGIVRALVEAQE